MLTPNLPTPFVRVEAWAGSSFLGMTLRKHKVRLIPAQLVRPFLKLNKNGYP